LADAPFSYSAYQSENSNARFTDWLAASGEPYWTAACTHPFTVAIGDDTMAEEAYARYLVQDYVFITDLASVLGYLVAMAPTMAAKSRLSAFLALLTSEENDYFLRSFEALAVARETYQNATQTETTQAFAGLMLASAQNTYAEGLACLLCAEWCYLSWGEREALKPRPTRFYLSEWIDLHAGPGFSGFVNWIREEMDQVGQALDAKSQDKVARTFNRMCELEVAFFDDAWKGPNHS